MANLDTGVPAVNALAGRSVAIAGSAERDRGGIFRLDRLALTGDEFEGRRERAFRSGIGPATLAGRLDADIRDLRRAARRWACRSPARIAAAVTVEGPVGHPHLQARLDGRDVAGRHGRARPAAARRQNGRRDAAARRDRGRVSAARGLDGSLSLTADAGDAKEVAIRDLLLKAAGGVINADLRVDRRTLLARGKIERQAARSRALVPRRGRAARGPARCNGRARRVGPGRVSS